MVKMDYDLAEKTNIDKDNDARYKEIATCSEMTEEEADDFWSNEFSNETAEYDLFDNIYGLSEDDIDVPVEYTEELYASVDKLNAYQWDDYTEEEKMYLIEQYKDDIATYLGIENVPKLLFIDDEWGNCGYYDYKNNEIYLNIKYLDNPYEIVNIISHEMRHAYQHMRAEIGETEQDLLYKMNFENYITPIPLENGGCLFYNDYYDQYVEVEARVFASKIKEALYG